MGDTQRRPASFWTVLRQYTGGKGGRRGGHPGSRGGRHQLRVPLAGKVADIWDSEREQSRTADFQEFFKLLVKHETLHFVNLKLNSTNDKGDTYSERVAS